MNSNTVINAVNFVTKNWTKQRKAEIRGKSSATRQRSLIRSYRVTIRDAAFDVMEEAYLKASANGKWPAMARQIMYAARGEILERTGESKLDSQYFTQTLLPDYMEENGCTDWDVAFDARGHFHEPHTNKNVALGTIDVRKYLRNVSSYSYEDGDDHPDADFDEDDRFPTCGPDNRYSAVLFIEKEGFTSLLDAAQIAKRYDIAVMSTKGLSNTSARHLVDEVCGGDDIPLLVLHDFDQAGFRILGTLSRDTRRYGFQHEVEVIDLGIRLEDVQKYNLAAEDVRYHSYPESDLRKNGATDEEVEFLYHGGYGGGHGQRVELNAFTSDALIEWIEGKLEEHGIKKVIPDQTVVEMAYRRALEIATVRNQLGDITKQAHEAAAKADVPDDLLSQIKNTLAATPSLPWDLAVARIAAGDVE